MERSCSQSRHNYNHIRSRGPCNKKIISPAQLKCQQGSNPASEPTQGKAPEEKNFFTWGSWKLKKYHPVVLDQYIHLRKMKMEHEYHRLIVNWSLPVNQREDEYHLRKCYVQNVFISIISNIFLSGLTKRATGQMKAQQIFVRTFGCEPIIREMSCNFIYQADYLCFVLAFYNHDEILFTFEKLHTP